MNEIIELNLQFKGSRTYLQGGDIYNAIQDALGIESPGFVNRLVFRQLARRQCALSLSAPPDPATVTAIGKWQQSDSSPKPFWLIERLTPVAGAYEFDEASIIESAALNGESILGVGNRVYSAIENVIALTKRLNYSLSPLTSGKWLFGQIDLHERLPEEWQAIRIRLFSSVAERFSRNFIEVDDRPVGEIRFIVGEP